MKKLAIVGAAILLAGLGTASGVSAGPAGIPDVGVNRVLFSIPYGDAGVGLSPGGQEVQAWGPQAIAIGSDGTLWIADSVSRRLVGYTRVGVRTAVVDLGAVAGNIEDLAVAGSRALVLDTALMQVLQIDLPTMRVTGTRSIPTEHGLDAGLTGVSIAPDGTELVEYSGSDRALPLGRIAIRDETAKPAVVGSRGTFVISKRESPTHPRSKATVTYGSATVEVKVDGILAGIEFLGEQPASFDIVVDEMLQERDGVVRVDETIRRIGLDGSQVGIARIPVADRATYVAHGVVVSPTGDILALTPRATALDVVLVGLASSVEPLLTPDELATPESLAEADQADAPTDAGIIEATAGCLSRQVMDQERFLYTSNTHDLTNANKNGVCAGRVKPRSLNMGPPFQGVTYDWGGYETVATWFEWQPNDKVPIAESTTTSALDRTVKRTTNAAYLNGYTPVRYVNACE